MVRREDSTVREEEPMENRPARAEMPLQKITVRAAEETIRIVHGENAAEITNGTSL